MTTRAGQGGRTTGRIATTDGGAPREPAGGHPDGDHDGAGQRSEGGKRAAAPANVFSLFDNEEAVLDRTEVMLTQLAAVADGVKVLAEAYRRGYREQRRLVRLSDRMQADLQKANKRLAEQQRDLQTLNEALSGEIETSARLEAELRRLADTDPLTGALARRRFLEVCARDWPRRPGQRACLLMLDLDRFKLVNDSHGHAAGDAALIAFVAACRSALRSLDAVGRLGGEEFAILLVETGPEDGALIAERIRAAVAANPVATEGGPIGITVSIGLAASGPEESLEAAMRRADAALYGAKHGGRNRVEQAPSPEVRA
ncbi:diguanylate cyclase (GGDEF) domain-containing protein [Methylobacterium sp. 174MFSha1.1]|uniref:GGDEF domain-containing protein n=1 Tax=Methylobacterium sp. 174MFSha1.1 TaxID=1502749 RepID=UPI0008E5F79B|nr:GGDEF domain-containing protein [Methylobacterium sp. 174MFSha1.1]SFU87543.1 diguanylate cyclase (GGDEF) domain-containing protein [Methylobacterium sp. 174MFSha1.1]